MLSKKQVFLAPCFTFSRWFEMLITRLDEPLSWPLRIYMEDKNRDQSVPVANSNDLRQHFEFAHAIVVAIGDNCPTAEWCSWKDVPQNVKKAVMDELLCKYTLDDHMNE
ncbi:uncharacterized protein [Pyrus communis]